jgi:cell wall-associated NlpC family hydrolase
MATQSINFVPVSASRQHELKLRARILSVASSYLGTPYKLGGKSKDGGIDCSGFVTTVLLTALESRKFEPLVQNISKLRSSPILETVQHPEQGDLVLWAGHGGIVWDPNNGKFIGAQTSTGVAVASYDAGYWGQQQARMFRRFGSYFVEWSKEFLKAI